MTRIKSPAQLTAKASFLRQETVKLCEENTKQYLELQNDKTKIRVEENKHSNAIVVQLLG